MAVWRLGIGLATLLVAGLLVVGCGGKRDSEAQVVEEPDATEEQDEIAEIADLGEVEDVDAGTPQDEALRAQVAKRTGFDGDVTIEYPEGGTELEATYRDGIKHGPWVKYHANGQIFEQGEYVGGEKHGTWVTYYPTGQKLQEGAYENGEPVGIHRAWLPDGTLIVERDMSRGLY